MTPPNITQFERAQILWAEVIGLDIPTAERDLFYAYNGCTYMLEHVEGPEGYSVRISCLPDSPVNAERETVEFLPNGRIQVFRNGGITFAIPQEPEDVIAAWNHNLPKGMSRFRCDIFQAMIRISERERFSGEREVVSLPEETQEQLRKHMQ